MSDLISPKEVHERQDTATTPLVIDVRGPDEYAAGHVQDAVNIPLDDLAGELARIPQNWPVVTYCSMYHHGTSRGERAATLLRERGYQAQTLDGGYPAWKAANLPVAEAPQQSQSQQSQES